MNTPQARTATAPQLQALPRGLVNLADHEALARQQLSDAAWAYIQGGAADEITLRANRQAWDTLQLRPRVLRSLCPPPHTPTLLGRPLPQPLLLAPVAYQRLAHPDGELASACAASAQGAGYVLSAQASWPLSGIARAVAADTGRGPLWFQLYWQGSREATLALAQRAIEAGFEALVLTVDAPVHGARDRERRANFVLPAGIEAVNLSHPMPTDLALLKAQAPTWDDVAWLRQQVSLPLVLKGVLHPEDARLAQQVGADGLIVSNHGGRTLDTAVSTAQSLPAIRRAVGPDLPLLVDGGIRRGTDVLKALALGAHAVLIGRPVIMGLSSGGAAGVAHVIRLLLDEFEMALALCGFACAADVNADVLYPHSGARDV